MEGRERDVREIQPDKKKRDGKRGREGWSERGQEAGGAREERKTRIKD